MRYYVIADLHGRYDLLVKAEEAIAEDADRPGEFKTIFLGDYIDRGPQSKEIIEYLSNVQQDAPEEVICLQGNHEAMAIETIVHPLAPDWWMGNGGFDTIKSYKEDAYWGEIGWIAPDHVKWMAGLPLYYETEKHVFVHAGIPYRDLPLDKQDTEKMQWMLYSNEDQGWWKVGTVAKHVVHGHHQFRDGPHEWQGRTDLDCHAYHTGRLVIGIFDDTQHKALRYLEVYGDDHASKETSSQA